METYDVQYRNVTCVGVDWESKPHKFIFKYQGRLINYTQKKDISCVADTDYIRCVINEFLMYDLSSVEKEQLIIEEESKNLLLCPHCKSAELIGGDYGWAGDECHGYKVICRCKRVNTTFQSTAREAVTLWNNQITNKNYLIQIKKLVNYLSDHEKSELIKYINGD